MKTPGFLRVTAACLLVACSEKPPIGPPNPTTLTFSTVAAGFATSCALTTDSAAYCWGYDINGTLGTGPSTGASKSNPVKVLGGLAFSDLSVGYGHSCGVVRGGAAYCWGVNDDGALGDGTTEFRYTPTEVTGSLVFTSISTGSGQSCGITTDQAAYCWGSDYSGALGDGSVTNSAVPVAVAGGLHFGMISVGAGHACGVTTESVAYCWGYGQTGELGDGVSIPRDGGHAQLSPVPVVGGLTFATVSAAGFTCGITTVGAAYCWGANVYGELGNGSAGPETCDTYPCSTTPLPVLGGLTFATVSAGIGYDGMGYACGVTTTGAAYCWGNNTHGQLGDGTTTDRMSPVAALGGHKFAMVRAGLDFSSQDSHTCGVTTDGEAYCWGSNNKGQLGDGTTNNSSVPVKVVVQQ